MIVVTTWWTMNILINKHDDDTVSEAITEKGN